MVFVRESTGSNLLVPNKSHEAQSQQDYEEETGSLYIYGCGESSFYSVYERKAHWVGLFRVHQGEERDDALEGRANQRETVLWQSG